MKYVIEVDVQPENPSTKDEVELLDQIEDRINAITFSGLGRVIVTEIRWVVKGDPFNNETTQKVFT